METTTKKVDVGFLEECESWKLHSRFFPSKVGGKPSWLNLKDLPSTTELQCDFCLEPCIFLCQVYAPIDDCERAFHRTLFVFVCKKGSCCRSNLSGNLKVFRCQLKKENIFFSPEPPSEEKQEFDLSKWPPTCVVCGAKGSNHCGKCKSINYCSRSHQVFDWKDGHKERCTHIDEKNFIRKERNCSLLFPEWELTTEEESEDIPSVSTEEDQMKYLNKLIEENKAGSLINESATELEQYANADIEDKIFEKFKNTVTKDPDQVLRYDRGGLPLWISPQKDHFSNDVPPCPYCNGERQYECQIMPQLLNFLKLEGGVDSIDWGVIAIYTCKENCCGEVAYQKEFIYKQDIS